MANDDNRLLTADQVAEMLQLPRCTIYGWVHKKRIKVLKLSRKMIRFRQSDIEAFLESKTQGVDQQIVPLQQPASQKPAGGRRKKSQSEINYVESLVSAAKREAGIGTDDVNM